MSVDLSKLSPAPWVARGEAICCGLYKEPEHYLIFDPDATWADTQFVALARAAFDVMLRRGWTARRISNGRWLVQDDCNTPLQQEQSRPGRLDWFEAADPFTALVAADEFMKEVEHRKGEVVDDGGQIDAD